jgi:hypothetical protein
MPTETENRIADAVEHAEEINHPLQGLIERAASDPSAPFNSEVLSCLIDLKHDDPAAFEKMRAELEAVGVRVAELDRAIAGRARDVRGRQPKQIEMLLELAEDFELFHSPDGTPYADIFVNGHRETWRIRDKGFEHHLRKRFYNETLIPPRPDAWRMALETLEARAELDSPERHVYMRVAAFKDSLYVDLCDLNWRTIKIAPQGWEIVTSPPVRFRRARGMRPLPEPEPGGSVEELRPYLNVGSNEDFVMAIAWLLAALRHPGPYPVMVLSGEQGSAKSTCGSILRELVDPNSTGLRSLPRDSRDLFIAAKNGHVLAFDNVSDLSGWMSDCLCRLATGGGQATRELFTDDDEVLFKAQRPIIINGIEHMVTRPDLADRSIFITLEPIPGGRRVSEQELWSKFRNERPRILGALLDVLAHGLRTLPDIEPRALPRMADFALLAMACEGALWPRGTFERAYERNRQETMQSAIEADAVASAVGTLMAARTMRTTRTQISGSETEWEGTASDLLRALDVISNENVCRDKTWPKTALALANRLRRAAPFLRERGLEIKFLKQGHDRTRMIHIIAKTSAPKTVETKLEEVDIVIEEDDRKNVETFTNTSSAPSAPSAKIEAIPQNAPRPGGNVVPKGRHVVLKPQRKG